MGSKQEKQEELYYASEQAEAPGHPFYLKLNAVLSGAKFDAFCEEQCPRFYHAKLGRPSMPPGVYFRLLLIGFFEGIASERGICWRVADSLSLRRFLNYSLSEATPDHVTMSRTRRLFDEAVHKEVFTFVLTEVARRGMLKGKTIGIDATTLEANAAMRSIVRRDTGQSYMEYLRQLAAEAGIDPNDDAAAEHGSQARKEDIEWGVVESARSRCGSDEDEGWLHALGVQGGAGGGSGHGRDCGDHHAGRSGG